MNKTTNIFLCGVGGQGILLASEVISSACMKAGFDIKQSEVHGMAQRGGSVIAHLRYGEKVYSPLIEPGEADFVVAFELLEALRYLPYMNKDTRVVVNTQKILPAPVATGVDTYPADVLDQLAQRKITAFALDAFALAKAAGETRAVNLVLVGALSALLSLGEKFFLQAIGERIPEKIREKNITAFMKGKETLKGMMAKPA